MINQNSQNPNKRNELSAKNTQKISAEPKFMANSFRAGQGGTIEPQANYKEYQQIGTPRHKPTT
jgi:hypothetical protein